MKQKKRYPPEMLAMGLFMTLARTALIPILALILTLLRIPFPDMIPVLLSPVLLVVWLLYAVVDQLRVRHHIMTSGDPLFETMLDPDHADDWKDRAREEAERKIRAHRDREEATGEPESENENMED